MELTDDVEEKIKVDTLIAQADAYVGLARSLDLAGDSKSALESVMRARKLYALSGTSSSTSNVQAVVAGSFEAEILLKLDMHREALGSMNGAYKLALGAQDKNHKLVQQLSSSLQKLRVALGVKD